jgi:CrcB protein
MDQFIQQPIGKVIALSLAAIVGVNARYWLGVYIQYHVNPSFPWGTIIINLTGSFLLGILMGVTARTYDSSAANQLRLILGTGFQARIRRSPPLALTPLR